MTVRSVPIFLQAGSHPAEETRLMLGGMLGTVTGSFAGGVASSDPAHGVVNVGDLAVTQNGTPNMSVNVIAGGAFIRGTQNANQGAYHVWNDGTVNLSISAADATNGRRDLVIAQVRDSYYSGSTDDARLTVVTGTPAAVPVDPSLASFPNALVLARITVAAGDTAINTADITNLRTVANQIGKIPTYNTSALATVANPSPVDGQAYYLNLNTDQEGVYFFNGSQYRRPWNMPWGYVTDSYLAANTVYTAGLNWGAVFTWNGTNIVANRRYLMRASVILEPGNLGQMELELGTGIGTGNFAKASHYANGTSWIATLSTAGVFTTTAGSMTRYVSRRMSSGTGTVRALGGSTFEIIDIGPAGAPA